MSRNLNSICQKSKMKSLVLKIQLSVTIFFVSLLTTSINGVGGDHTDPYSDGSNINGDSSLCRVIRDTRKTVLTAFSDQYSSSGAFCDIADLCANITCSAAFSRGGVKGGLLLNLCKEDPELTYWVDIPGQWDHPWNYTFSSKNSNGRIEKQKITGSLDEEKPTMWFIAVRFYITQGHNQVNQAIKYISTLSVLQICQSGSVSEANCSNITLLNFPRLPQSQICEFPILDSNSIGETVHHHQIALLRKDNSPITIGGTSSTRSSRNANAWDPEQLRISAAERTKKFENGQPLKATLGDSCVPDDFFSCREGSTCVSNSYGSGTCQCRPDFSFNATSGVCVKHASSPLDPSDPSSADSLNSRSYSSAIGAIVSIIVLIGIAAGIYFGTKYNYFTRLRHRIPVLRCWPFRRSQPWEDNVTMVNPLGPPDDDDPPLL